MTFYKFSQDDLFLNTIEAYPQFKFYIQSGTIYINNYPHFSGANTDNIIGVPKGFVSLYEYNIDRPTNSQIHPFVVKGAGRINFRGNATASFNSYQYGTVVTSSYNMSASIKRYFINPPGPYGTRYSFAPHRVAQSASLIGSLENVFNHYNYLSPQYQYRCSSWDKSNQTGSLIAIPSIFYGSKIKKGSVSLKYYISGTLIGELQDTRYNGDLVQVGPYGSTGSGSVAGSILYNEGFIFLTGSWSLDSKTIAYDVNGNSKWIHFGFGANDGTNVVASNMSASFSLEYSGSSHTQTMTMLAHAGYGELNHSNNPTFIKSSVTKPIITGSYKYVENSRNIKNIVSSSFTDEEPKIKKTTYLSKIAIYDKDKNLIGIAKMATPVRKTEDDQYTFKLKLDI